MVLVVDVDDDAAGAGAPLVTTFLWIYISVPVLFCQFCSSPKQRWHFFHSPLEKFCVCRDTFENFGRFLCSHSLVSGFLI